MKNIGWAPPSPHSSAASHTRVRQIPSGLTPPFAERRVPGERFRRKIDSRGVLRTPSALAVWERVYALFYTLPASTLALLGTPVLSWREATFHAMSAFLLVSSSFPSPALFTLKVSGLGSPVPPFLWFFFLGTLP